MPRTKPNGSGQAGPHTVRGVITLVQEDRFTLCCDDGSYRLFLLSPHCPADPAELEQAMRRDMRVVVECKDAPQLIAAEARRIFQDDNQSGAGV